MDDWDKEDPLDVFEQHEGDELDHLVPADERTADASYQPTDGARDGQRALESMRAAWHDAETAHQARQQWPAEVAAQLDAALAAVVQAQTPSAEDRAQRDDVVGRIDALVRSGLDNNKRLFITAYGSFLSGLYSPNGDLDLSIEGLVGRHEREPGEPVASLGKQGRAKLLRALSRRLERGRFAADGRIQHILHARVPIVKFACARTGIPCDVSVGSANSQFKAHVLRGLAAMDARFPALVRAVKVWAAAHNLNDASAGTFNSFALSLMVLFHLQQREAPLMPPLHTLFRDDADAVSSRPLHLGRTASNGHLQVFQDEAGQQPQSGNGEGLAQLLGSFFARWAAALQLWADDAVCREVRASPWRGGWAYRQWPKYYMAGVEDPFDASDNCARTIGEERIGHIVGRFAAAAEAMSRACDETGAEQAMTWLFKGVMPPEAPGLQALMGVHGNEEAGRNNGRRGNNNNRRGRRQQQDRNGNGREGRAAQQGFQSVFDHANQQSAPPAITSGAAQISFDDAGRPAGMQPTQQAGRQGSGNQQIGQSGQLPSNAILQSRRQPSGALPLRGAAGSPYHEAQPHSPMHSPGHPAAQQHHAGPGMMHPGMHGPAQQLQPPPSRFQPGVPPPGFGGPFPNMQQLAAYHNQGGVAYPNPGPPPGFPGPHYAPRPLRPPPPPGSPGSPRLASPTYQNQQQSHFQRQHSPFQPPQQQQPYILFNPPMQGLRPAYLPHLHGGFPAGSLQQQTQPPPGFQQQPRPPPQHGMYTPVHHELRPQQQQQHGMPPAPAAQGAGQQQQQPKQPYYERLIASEPTQALRQMLNVGGGDRSGARLGYAAPALQQWQGGAADVEATGEALRDMLHIRGGASGSTAGGAHAAANGGGGQAQLQRRVSRRDSFGLPDSLDLGTLDIDPGKPLGSSEGFAHAQPQQQQQHQQQQAHAPHAKAAEPRAVPVHIPAAYGARLISTQEADSLPGRSPASSAGAPGRVLHVPRNSGRGLRAAVPAASANGDSAAGDGPPRSGGRNRNNRNRQQERRRQQEGAPGGSPPRAGQGPARVLEVPRGGRKPR